jgi:hypothetical protein
LLSTVFSDLWRPLVLAVVAAVVLGLGEQLLHDVLPFGISG